MRPFLIYSVISNLVNSNSNSFIFISPFKFIGSHFKSGKFKILLIFLDVFGINGAIRFDTFAIIYAYFRAFSKNIASRHRENDWYINEVAIPLGSYLKRDRKNYAYFKCPTCRQVLRAPKGRGRIRVICSRCTSKFEKKV